MFQNTFWLILPPKLSRMYCSDKKKERNHRSCICVQSLSFCDLKGFFFFCSASSARALTVVSKAATQMQRGEKQKIAEEAAEGTKINFVVTLLAKKTNKQTHK